LRKKVLRKGIEGEGFKVRDSRSRSFKVREKGSLPRRFENEGG